MFNLVMYRHLEQLDCNTQCRLRTKKNNNLKYVGDICWRVGGVCLGGLEDIWGYAWEVCGGVLKKLLGSM